MITGDICQIAEDMDIAACETLGAIESLLLFIVNGGHSHQSARWPCRSVSCSAPKGGMMEFTVIPDVVCKQTIRSMLACETALSAAQCMNEHDISAILVVDADGLLIGIVTERDLARRVVAAGKSGADLQLGDIMTAAPKCVAPQDSPFDALELMRDHRVRHVPVVDGDEIVGMVSIRDLRHAIASMTRAGGGGLFGRLTRAFAAR
ncbi:MAG: putative transcriptional regulator [Gammaproteobacteria bacterium]